MKKDTGTAKSKPSFRDVINAIRPKKIKLNFKLKKVESIQKAPLKIKSRPIKIAISALICLFFALEFVFAVSIYAFGSKDSVTRTVAQFVPYPAVFTASGVVPVKEYWMEKEYIEHFYASTKQTDYDPSELSDQILAQAAENAIIAKESIAYKKTVSADEVDAAMAEIYDGNGGVGEVEKALQDLYGLSVKDFRKLVKTQLLRDKMNKEVIAHVTARHILIRTEEGATDEQVNEAKARIDGYSNEIKAGLSFEEAATKYSEDVGSNQDGGLLEAFARGDMIAEFEDVAFSTPVGQISEPFKTSYGWHIVKVESTSGYVGSSFDDWVSGLMDRNFVFYFYKD